MNWELPDVQAGLRKGWGTRDQIANICWIIEKAREFQRNINFCFIDYTKAFVWITTNWKILKEYLIILGFPDSSVGKESTGTTGDPGSIPGSGWSTEKARVPQKNINFCFTDYAKAFECLHHHKLWKILKEIGIPDYLTCLLRNLYAGQEATVRTGHGTADLFQIRKGVGQGCILSPCIFNL